jgi:two-component sensor histidine kinase
VNQAFWPQREPPHSGGSRTLGVWGLAGVSALTVARQELGGQLGDQGMCNVGGDEADRLLLTFEELASNGLRHGRTPVTVRVMHGSAGWLIDVSDAATDRPPLPALDRDPACGGMGLRMVASLCQAHGWTVHAGRKHVWACILTTD